jgi:O-antigen/teichoic acid export membrane protein
VSELEHAEVVNEQPKRSAGRTIAKNTVFAIGSQFALKAVGFIFTVLVVRNLGGTSYGQYQTVLAWAGFFAVLGDLGISQYYTREINRDRTKANELFWNIVVLRFLLAVITAVITIGGAVLSNYNPEIILGIVIYTSSYFLSAFLDPILRILDGHERLDITSVLGVIGQIVFLTLGGLFLFAGLDFVWLVVAELIRLPVLLFLALLNLRRNNMTPGKFHISPEIWRSLIQFGLPFAFVQLSLTFAFHVDTIILSHNVSDQNIAWYRISYNLIFTMMAFALAFNNAMRLTLAREHAANPASVRPWYYYSVRVMLFVSLPIAVGTTVLAYKIMPTIFGPENLPASITLMILIWDMPLLMYNAFCGDMTTAIRREKSGARIYGIEAVTNVGVNLLLIPLFGVIAASFVTVLTDLVGAVLFYFLFRREFGSGLELRKLIRLGISAVLMGVVVFLLRDWNLLVVIPIGAVSYLLFIWLTGAFSQDEQERLFGMVARRLRLSNG